MSLTFLEGGQSGLPPPFAVPLLDELASAATVRHQLPVLVLQYVAKIVEEQRKMDLMY